MKLTPEIVDSLEAYWGKPSSRNPLSHFAEATFALIAEWRERQEPAKTTGQLVAGFRVETSQVCIHCKMPIEAHHGEDLRCHLSAFHGVNTFMAEPVKEPEYKEPLCRHCGKDEGNHWWPGNTCTRNAEPGKRWTVFES